MEVIGIETPTIIPQDNLVEIILKSISNSELELDDDDILVVASSVVSTVEKRIRSIEEARSNEKAENIAEESGMDENFVEIIIQEADEVLAPAEHCILTMVDGLLKVNAGIDRTNVPEGQVLLLPENPENSANEIRKRIGEKTGKDVGIVISDSQVNPLRLGTTGQAIGCSGIKETLDYRNKEDLYGKKLQMTFRAIGDQLASAAQPLMGEADESTPVVLIRGVDIMDEAEYGGKLKIPSDKCIYSKICRFEDAEF